MSLLNLSKPIVPPLKPGEYRVTLAAFAEVAPKKQGGKPYVRFDLKFTDRITNDNRFEQGLDIMLSQLRDQLCTDDEVITTQDLLDRAKATEFSLWVSYVEQDGKTYRNFSYRAPVIHDEAADEEDEEV
jgi:hypothetical protein